MSLMEEWIKLFPNGKPRSNANEVAGSSEAFPNFDSQLSPFRGADNWAYDAWDEDTQYPLKGVNSELGWMAAQLNNAQYQISDSGLGNLAEWTNLMGSFEQRRASPKENFLKARLSSSQGKAVKGNYRGMTWEQISTGRNSSEAGLKEYDSISLAEFKVL